MTFQTTKSAVPVENHAMHRSTHLGRIAVTQETEVLQRKPPKICLCFCFILRLHFEQFAVTQETGGDAEEGGCRATTASVL